MDEGEGNELIVGRIDLRILDVIGENFPMKMTEAKANLERKARANTIIEMEDEEDNYQSMAVKAYQALVSDNEAMEEVKREADEEAMDGDGSSGTKRPSSALRRSSGQ